MILDYEIEESSYISKYNMSAAPKKIIHTEEEQSSALMILCGFEDIRNPNYNGNMTFRAIFTINYFKDEKKFELKFTSNFLNHDRSLDSTIMKSDMYIKFLSLLADLNLKSLYCTPMDIINHIESIKDPNFQIDSNQIILLKDVGPKEIGPTLY